MAPPYLTTLSTSDRHHSKNTRQICTPSTDSRCLCVCAERVACGDGPCFSAGVPHIHVCNPTSSMAQGVSLVFHARHRSPNCGPHYCQFRHAGPRQALNQGFGRPSLLLSALLGLAGYPPAAPGVFTTLQQLLIAD